MLEENKIEKGGKSMDFREIAKTNFSQWADALKTKDPKVMAEFYSENCTFLPTLSPDFKKGAIEAEGYFVHFLEKNPEASIKDQSIQLLGSNSYLHSGMYDFEVGSNGDRQMVHARFSYVWEKQPDGRWKIIHHHSSLKPE